MIKELFDVQYLPDYDFDSSRIIIEPNFINFYMESATQNGSILGEYIEQKVTSITGNAPVPGNVYIVTDESGYKKLYVIYIKMAGISFAKRIQYFDMDAGVEINYNLSQSDYEAMKQIPFFAGDDDTELTFFLSTLDQSVTYTQSVHGSNTIGNVLQFLKSGLWVVSHANDNQSPSESEYFGNERTFEMFGQTLVTSGIYVVGPYEAVKQLYLTGNNRETMKFGGSGIQDTSFMILITLYNDKLAEIASKEQKVIEEQKIAENPIPQSDDEKAKVIEQMEDSWDSMKELEELMSGSGKKKERKKKFAIEGEISEQERMMAAQEVASEKVEKIKAKRRSKNLNRLPIDIANVKNEIAVATNVTLPTDWDYVYSIRETSAMYNLTVGKKYIPEKKEWVDDETQNTGMTIAEWNAYFLSNPQYSHLIEEAIGQWGGITYTEEQLRAEGALLYNPVTGNLEYSHIYLKGNAYERMDETVAAKEKIIALYGEDFYEVQIARIKAVTPYPKSINDPDSSQAPFIHPLDDININFFIKTAGGLSFSRFENKKIVSQYKKLLKSQRKKKGDSGNYDSLTQSEQEQELSFLSQPQDLNIVIFFKNWLAQGENHGLYYYNNEIPIPRSITYTPYDKKGNALTPTTKYVNAVEEFYFGNKGYKEFAEYASGGVQSWNLVNPATGRPYSNPSEVGKSEYFEFRDNLKRMVNQAFQDFITQELEPEDISRLNDIWNRRYNGFIKLDVYKYPIFIRHRKYFKDVQKRIRFMLDKSQVEGIKFGTINNSSIMAHEVGYGKTTLSIAYMSHMFETGQARNIMVAVPKALYDNSKWKEEIMGKDDIKRGQKILGISPPEYNLIELGNLSPNLILGKLKTDRESGSKSLSGSSPYKTYSFDEVVNIEDFKKMRDEFELRGYDDKDGYKIADLISGKDGVSDIIAQLKVIDSVLYKKCSGDDAERVERIISIFDLPASKFWGSTKDEQRKKMTQIGLDLMAEEVREFIQNSDWISEENTILLELIDERFGLIQEYKQNPSSDLEEQIKELEGEIMQNKVFTSKMYKVIDIYKRDADGNIITKVDPKTQDVIKERKQIYEAFEEYIAETLSGLVYNWMYDVLNRMYENGIYEYGQWNFNSSEKNIFLVSHEALKRIGFGPSAIQTVIDRVTEFSTYNEPKSQTQTADDDEPPVYVVEANASASKDVSKVFSRNIKRTMEKQYAQVISLVNNNMTYNSKNGKLMIDSLSIDGFIFDEAHKGKKLFTNAVSNSVFEVNDEKGVLYRIKKSGHDIHGGGASDLAVQMFGMCQYVRSLGDTKPVMLLTATPFSNQPTEIFTMLAMVGVKQLREQGVANVKNFFDLFLNESLKYTFDHTGQFVKRITVEDFRNKELLLQMIWSIIDIKREETRIREFERDIKLMIEQGASEREREEKMKNMKPARTVLPQLNTATSYAIANAKTPDEARKRDKNKDCDDFKQVTTTTTAQLKQDLSLVASIVNRNSIQEEIMADLEKVALALPNPNNPILNEDGTQKVDKNNMPMYHPYTFKDICPEVVITNEGERPENESLIADVSQTAATDIDNQVVVTKKGNEGRVFKTLALSQAVALSPYFYNCYELPEPTPENVIKLSPKIEYLVKALISVKKYHIEEIPKIIKATEAQLEKLSSKTILTPDEINTINALRNKLPRLKAALKVSGQVVYLNKVRFKYKGKDYNLVHIIREYLVKEGTFSRDEIGYVGTGGDPTEKTIKDFQDGKIQVFFGTPAIKEGVDLQQNGSILYVLTPDWNPTDMRQIEGRIWRRGNPYRQIRVVYILLDQSVEIFVYAKLEEKSQRLKRIMQERNYVLELEEMSLDPKETQIALASDPSRRVDMITKTCLEILKERKQKLEVSTRALKEYSDTSALVSSNIEAYFYEYMLPYFDSKIDKLKQLQKISLDAAEAIYNNDRDKFIRNFCYKYIGKQRSDRSYSYVQKDEILTAKLKTLNNNMLYLGMAIIAVGADAQSSTLYFSNVQWDKAMCMDYLSALKVILENKSQFSDPVTDKYVLLDTLLPMRYTSSQSMSNLARSTAMYNLPSHTVIGGYMGSSIGEPFTIGYDGNNREVVKLFTAGSIFCMPSHLQKLILDTINHILNSPNMSRTEMGDALRAIVPTIIEDMIGIVKYDASNRGFIKPENDSSVINAGVLVENAEKTKDDIAQTFPQHSVIKKAQLINKFDDNEIRGIMYSTSSLTKAERERIEAGKVPSYKSPGEYFRYILPMVGVEIGISPDFSGYKSLYEPISNLGDKSKEIRAELASVGVTDEGQIKFVYEKAQEKLEAVITAISEIEASKDVLYEKYKNELEEKKKITLDDIINAFSKLNTTLQDRSPEQN